MKTFALFIAILMVFTLGCEDNAAPISSKNPYTSLSVTYDAVTNNSTGIVFLWQDAKNGKLLVLDKDEKLRLNERSLQYQSSDGSYKAIFESYFPPYTFTLLDLKSNKYVNSISGNRISFPQEVQYNGDTVNISFPVAFKWNGLPLDTNETITLSIGDKKFKQDTLSSVSIVILENDLALLKGKTILATLERNREAKLQQKPGSDGSISLLYKAQPHEIVFKEGPAPFTNKNVYAEFAVVHDAATNISTGTAQFWEGSKSGNNLFIDAAALLQFQSKNLDRITGSTMYSTTMSGFLSLYQFRFVDINKKEFINTITGARISLPAIIQNNSDTVNSALPLQIAWSDAAVDTSEKVTVRISTKNFMQDSLGKKSITIPAAELAVFKSTTQQLFIERMKVTPLQKQLGTNGSISNRYIALPKQVYFK